MGESVSEFVWDTREAEGAGRGRERSGCRVPLALTRVATQAAFRWSLTLPLPLTRTLADLRDPEGRSPKWASRVKHGAQTIEQSQQNQDFSLGGEVQYQHALQSGGRLARLAANGFPNFPARDTRNGRLDPAHSGFLLPPPAWNPLPNWQAKRRDG